MRAPRWATIAIIIGARPAPTAAGIADPTIAIIPATNMTTMRVKLTASGLDELSMMVTIIAQVAPNTASPKMKT